MDKTTPSWAARRGRFSTASILSPAGYILSAACIFVFTALLPDQASAVGPGYLKGQDPATEGRAENIVSLTQDRTATGIAVTIRGDGSLSAAQAEILEDPPRLMLEFFGIIFPGQIETYKCEDKAIKRVRVSRSKPDRTRIIFDFAGEKTPPYGILHEGNVMRVEFTTVPAGDPAEATLPSPPEASPPVQDRKPAAPAGSLTADNKEAVPWRFSPRMRAGIMHAGEAGSFSIQTSGSGEVLSLSPKDSPFLTLGAGLRVSSLLDLDIDATGVTGIRDASLLLVSAGPRLWLSSGKGLRPYVRAAFTCGRLGWSDAPGKFRRGTGWEVGYGFSCPLKDWSLGLDFCSRNLSFTYRPPGDPAVTASEDRIDFSGYSLSISLAYVFR